MVYSNRDYQWHAVVLLLVAVGVDMRQHQVVLVGPGALQDHFSAGVLYLRCRHRAEPHWLLCQQLYGGIDRTLRPSWLLEHYNLVQCVLRGWTVHKTDPRLRSSS